MSAKLIHGRYDGNDMYMKGPITNTDRVRKLPFKKEEIVDFKANDFFNFNHFVFLRKENFGGTIFVDNKTDFLTDKGLKLLLTLRSKDFFSVEFIKEELGLEADKANIIFNKLYKSKIIMKGGEKNECKDIAG